MMLLEKRQNLGSLYGSRSVQVRFSLTTSLQITSYLTVTNRRTRPVRIITGLAESTELFAIF